MSMTFGTSRTQRRLRKKLLAQYETQLSEERAGAPIPGDIAEIMTKPKEVDLLYQVKVDVRDDSGRVTTIPASPKAGMDFCEHLMIALNGQIALGKLRGWGNARLEPVYATA